MNQATAPCPAGESASCEGSSNGREAIAGGARADCVSEAFVQSIARDFARQHLIVSQGSESGAERLAISATTDPAAVFNVGVRLQRRVDASIADAESIASAIDDAYARATSPAGVTPATDDAAASDFDRLLAAADRDLLSTKGKAPVVKLVDVLLFEALSRRASDVHIQPLADLTLIRYRLDGVLHTVRQLSAGSTTAAVISRIKVLGEIDIAERRMAQDGRATVAIGDRTIDLRISTFPTSHGERVVIRLLDSSRQLAGLTDDFGALGMPAELASSYLACARRTSGIILVTGPTGSGKTTTLYATLRRVGTSQVNIMTIEDPIEYELSGVGLAISQSQVNSRKGINFSTGLRHILRQDPDVIMVGEIRDVETARVAIQSSLTGHLVFSTLHTNDAPGAVTRLVDLGIEPYLVAASLSAVLAQRLVRLVHLPCGGRGCPECVQTGYRGRTGLFELMAIDDETAGLISRGSSTSDIRTAAAHQGLRTLKAAGHALVQAGLTTALEIERVVAGVEA